MLGMALIKAASRLAKPLKRLVICQGGQKTGEAKFRACGLFAANGAYAGLPWVACACCIDEQGERSAEWVNPWGGKYGRLRPSC